MNFRLFGFDIQVQASFWISTALLGYWGSTGSPRDVLPRLLVWVLAVLVSVLVHELGHAFAFRRYRIQSDIVLYHFGGLTVPRAALPLTRIENIVVSLSGPFAGFFLGGALFAFDHYAPHIVDRMPHLAQYAIGTMLWVNIVWGIINLLPVQPLDGGHVLESALGPKRERLAAGISLVVATGVSIAFLYRQWFFPVFIFGMSAYQSYRRLQALSPDTTENVPRARAEPKNVEEPLTGELLSLLLRAKAAVADEDLFKARSLAEEVLARQASEEPPPPPAIREALEVLGWVELVGGDTDKAARMVREAGKHGEVDAALVGGLHFARRDLREARKVLEAARTRGDDRKEIVGPLIQVLIEQGETARAAAVAYDIVDALSEEDARRMAKIAFEGRAFDWSARLYEAVFERGAQPEDAYDAARAHAQDGAYERALELLRKAVEAGFSDRGRAWSDAALEALRADRALETVLPRP
jgi:Zn-dependent protease/Flp pilus assembly protein TadD